MPSTQPNIILITAHDLGTHLGCYGWDPAISTPSLDRLSEQGVRFTNHFCTAPYCSPSRGAMLTGRYPHVNGLMGLVNLGWEIPEDNPFLPKALGQAGCQTSLFGFQHVTTDPTRLGYHHIVQEGGHSCQNVCPRVVEAIEQVDRETPFFYEIGFSEVHRPFGNLERLHTGEENVIPLPFLEDTPGHRLDLAAFYEHLRRLDTSVGTILDALDRQGLRNNTLVIFTTDHGIAFPRAKATLYDAGIRTALLLRWPDGFNGGRTISSMWSNVDLFATVAEIADAPVDTPINGRSYVAALRETDDAGRAHIFAEKNTTIGDAKRCVRSAHHKLIKNFDEGPLLALPTDIEVTATRRDMGEAHTRPRPPIELYDLDEDPLEQHNLAGLEDYRVIERTLDAELNRVMEETSDPLLLGPVPRPTGEASIMEDIRSKEGMRRRQEREASIWQEMRDLR